MPYFPLFCDLRQKAVLLVGGGDVAERKARLLLKAGAELRVCATHFSYQFHLWHQAGQLKLLEERFSPDKVDGCWLAIAATDNHEVNQQVSASAEARRIFCNVVDSPERASAILPAIVDRAPLMVAISSGGTAPVMVRLLREKIEALLPQHLGKIASWAGFLRSRVKTEYGEISQRRRFWEKFFHHDRLAQALANADHQQASKLTEALFAEPPEHRGEVVLVGAGPGDAGLLTLKGLQQIQQADVVVYDRLVSDDVMELVRRDAEKIFVGKRAGLHCVSQESITQMLLDQAQQGKRVVRLKGGDPFIFGRGAEELEALAERNIPFSVVPGITAASGCSAYSGIPLTHRDYAQSVRLVTGHVQKNGSLDWENLAAEKQTLVFYMGLSQAAEIQQQLIDHGMDAAMPVALVEEGTSIKQQVVSGQLSELATLATKVRSPSLIIVGRVVALRERLRWF